MNFAPVQLDESDGLTNLLMREVGPDTAREVIGELRVGWEAEKVLAGIRQRRIAEASARIERQSVEGLGQHTHSVDLFAYLYWHSRTNGECWKDPAFWAEYARDNPDTRVRTAPRGNRIQHPGLPGRGPTPAPAPAGAGGGRIIFTGE